MQTFLRANEPLARYSSWRIGGPARFFAEPATPEQLREVLDWAHERELALFVLGGGTNTLIRDTGFDGLVLRYRDQGLRIEPHEGGAHVWLGGGAPTAGMARKITRQGLAGLEWAEGVPGTIGGAVVGNAGCYGGDIASVLRRAWLLIDGQIEEWPVERMAYGYRTSALKDGRRKTKDESNVAEAGTIVSYMDRSSVVGRRSSVVIGAEFALMTADPQLLAERLVLTAETRRSKTPSGLSCGSVFKNPAGDSAGRLIEAAGLKGTQIGGVQVSEKHANYFVNVGGATSDDVLRLIDLARETVLRQFGVGLELEVGVVPGREA